MCNYNDDGREFIQGIFYNDQGFGEPPLFIDQLYPANAVAVEDTEIIYLPKNNFIKFFIFMLK